MSAPEELRTYGGWRRSRGIGLFGLSTSQSIVLLGGILLLIGAAQFSISATGLLAIVVIPAIVLTIVQWNGVPLGRGLLERWRWLIGSARGYTTTRAGVFASAPHAWQLPGVLSATQLISVSDPAGDYGMVWNRRSGQMTVTLRVAATSTWLADPEVTSNWVANWGSWLANLGYLPIVAHVAVTVDTAPDPGSRLAEHVTRRIAPNAPAAAQRILRRLVEISPAAAADVETRVSVTFNPSRSPAKPSNLTDAAAEISRALPGLQDSLAGCGVTVLGRASAGYLAAVVRTAFDPAARGAVGQLQAASETSGVDLSRYLDWETCGPVAAQEYPDSYEHDSGWSVSWAWSEAPRQQVHSDVLARLLSPGGHAKRVTLLYEPLSAGQAAQIVEKEVNAADFRELARNKAGRDESQRDRVDRERARQTAHEEAIGAGVDFLTLFVTTTVLDKAVLLQAVADVEARSDSAKIRLRRTYRSQGAGFAATLPCGVCPPALAAHWPR